MNITLTNNQVINTINVLDALGGKVLPVKLSFAAAKNLENLQNKIYKPYEKEMNKIRDGYLEKDEDGKTKKDEKGLPIYTDFEAFEEKMKELLDIENTFDCHEITEDMLEKCMEEEKYDNLTVKEISALMKFIKG